MKHNRKRIPLNDALEKSSLSPKKIKGIPEFDKPVKEVSSIKNVFFAGKGGKISKRAIFYTGSGVLLFLYAALCISGVCAFNLPFGGWLLTVAGAAGFAYHKNESGKNDGVQ